MNNKPGFIDIKANKNASGAKPWYERREMSWVPASSPIIDKYARKAGVNPNLVKAIAYIETTHGYYDLLKLGNEKSVLPMNVHVNYWKRLGYSRTHLNDIACNIKAGIEIISSIQKQLINPTPEKVTTLYNNLRADKVSAYGARVGQVMKEKPWRKSYESKWWQISRGTAASERARIGREFLSLPVEFLERLPKSKDKKTIQESKQFEDEDRKNNSKEIKKSKRKDNKGEVVGVKKNSAGKSNEPLNDAYADNDSRYSSKNDLVIEDVGVDSNQSKNKSNLDANSDNSVHDNEGQDASFDADLSRDQSTFPDIFSEGVGLMTESNDSVTNGDYEDVSNFVSSISDLLTLGELAEIQSAFDEFVTNTSIENGDSGDQINQPYDEIFDDNNSIEIPFEGNNANVIEGGSGNSSSGSDVSDGGGESSDSDVG